MYYRYYTVSGRANTQTHSGEFVSSYILRFTRTTVIIYVSRAKPLRTRVRHNGPSDDVYTHTQRTTMSAGYFKSCYNGTGLVCVCVDYTILYYTILYVYVYYII